VRADSLEPLFRPRSVAIVGASGDFSKTAGKPAAYLKKHGFAGRLFLVNPRYPDIDGVRCYSSVAELPEAPDVGLVLLGPGGALQAVRELAQRGARAAIVLSGGYAEIDSQGVAHQAELCDAAGEMRLLGPNTIGMVNLADRTALSASVALELDDLPVGGVSVVSQSGGMLGALLSRAAAHGLGLSKLIATGNEADVDVCDAIGYLLEDDQTRVIALYVESVRRPQQFRALAAAAADRHKPLVVFKIGRSEAGAQSATSHTGAMAGADRMYDALFRQTGAIRVNALTDLIDVSAALVTGKTMAGPRLAILTSTGGGGALVADAAGVHGFVTPPPDAATVSELRTALVGEGALADRNPIDLTLANLRSETYRDTIAALIESPTYDGLVVVVGSSGLGDPGLAAAPVRAAAEATRKPVLVYVSPHALNIVRHLNGVGVPAFLSAEGCAAALVALRQVPSRAQVPMPPSARREVTYLREVQARGQLNEAESLALFGRAGIPVVRQRVAHTPEEAQAFAAEIGMAVVVKVLSADVGHKSDAGGVAVGIAAPDVAGCCVALGRAVRASRADARIDGWLVQEQVIGGVEMLLGVVRDPQLGLAMVLGAGGVATEVFDDTALRLLPLQDCDPVEMLAQLKSRVLLEGFHGRAPADVQALYQAISQFAGLAQALGERLLEAEINPLFVLPAGQGVVAADGLVVLTKSTALGTESVRE
jgi:acetate---CoA ligase (ADP-forming)